MGVEAEDLLAQLVVEAAHDADDDDEHRDAQRDAQHGNQRDHRDEGPFGPQVRSASSSSNGNRDMRGKLDAGLPRVNESLGGEALQA